MVTETGFSASPRERPTGENPDGAARAGRIVVGVDGSPGGDAALRWAIDEARAHGAALEAVLAWDYLDQPPAPGVEGFDPHFASSDAAAALDAMVQQVAGAESASIAKAVICDLPARALLEAGSSADLLVVGARGLGGFKGLLLGSVSRRCTHLATVPLVVVHAGERERFHRIVVGVDGSEASERALRWALREAAARGDRLAVVHAYQSPAFVLSVGDEAANELVDRVLADATEAGEATDWPVQGSRPVLERVVVNAGAASALCAESASADLVVVGRRGHGGLSTLLLGSVADQVAMHSACPTAVIP